VRKRLFLHIGSHKTATTYLQGSFANSPEVMARLGLLYPQSGRAWAGHFRLVWALKSPDHAQTALEDLPPWAETLAEIDASPHPAALISAEDFSLGFDPSRLAPLAGRYDTQVIYYLRSPDSHLESFYNQQVKDFQTRESRTIETWALEQPLHFLDTSRLLAPWADVFGPAAIRLRLFDKAFLPDGIMADMLQVMGLTDRPSFAAPNDQAAHKVSLPPDALDFLRQSNPWTAEQKGHNDHVMRLGALAQSRPQDFHTTRAGLLSPRARQTIRARFRPSQGAALRIYAGLDASPYLPAQAPDIPDWHDRPAEADAKTIAKVAALLRQFT
jgi:hypothetical protein